MAWQGAAWCWTMRRAEDAARSGCKSAQSHDLQTARTWFAGCSGGDLGRSAAGRVCRLARGAAAVDAGDPVSSPLCCDLHLMEF
jgi:hypothetical protein